MVMLVVLIGWMVISIQSNRTPEANTWHVNSGGLLQSELKIAFLSDFHFRDNEADFERYDGIVSALQKAAPDLILLGGDFAGEELAVTRRIRGRIITELERLTEIAPTYAVMGNHEWWTDGNAWRAAIEHSPITLAEGKVVPISVNGSNICLRGVGDAYTGHYYSIPFEPNCTGLKITLTHDPYGIEIDPVGGFYLAGHTHCGQIKLPFIGAPWAPTVASESFHCGSGSNDSKAWITSSGIGTSIVPLRVGTSSSYEMVSVF